jgi:uncharacterized membrane protein
MKRIPFIDEMRGFALILMIIQHIFYYKDVSTNYTTQYSKNHLVSTSGTISRTLFIILVGVGLYESYINYKDEEKKYVDKRLNRALEILSHALLITIVSHVVYPAYGIKFGVLHFIGIASLLCIHLVKFPRVVAILGFLLLYFGNQIPQTGITIIDLMLGTNGKYFMMDYFPLIKWLPYVFMGIFVAFLYHKEDARIFQNTILENIGKKTLNIYTGHVILFMVVFKLLAGTAGVTKT